MGISPALQDMIWKVEKLRQDGPQEPSVKEEDDRDLWAKEQMACMMAWGDEFKKLKNETKPEVQKELQEHGSKLGMQLLEHREAIKRIEAELKSLSFLCTHSPDPDTCEYCGVNLSDD